MDSNLRRREPHVPDAEKRDASIEYVDPYGIYLIARNNGQFLVQISYCPWCGSDLMDLGKKLLHP